MTPVPHLFDPLSVRGITLKNRAGVSPMVQYSSADGFANDWHLVHLGSRAVGGAGLVFTEATAVEPRGRITPQDLGLWSDDHVEGLSRITRFLKEQNAVPAIQLAHAGRKASHTPAWEGGKAIPVENGGWTPIGPSPIAFDTGDPVPAEMSLDDIRHVLGEFRAAAKRALAAGFDIAELHAAHGYLCHSFYSPLSNRREDDYGGSFEGRIRFTIEALREIRSVWPEDRPVFVRLSCSDWAEGGWTIEDSVALSRRLKAEGADVIDCSSGGLVPYARIQLAPGYQVPFAEAIRNGAKIPTAAVGLITEPAQADEIVRSERADIVLLAREELRDPYWPIHAAHALGHTALLEIPRPYHRGIAGKHSAR